MGLLLHHTCNNQLTPILQVSYIQPRCDKIIVSSCQWHLEGMDIK